MDSHGVKILDGTDDDNIVLLVPHDLQLKLFPADDRLLDEDLADHAAFKASLGQDLKLINVVGHRCPGTSKGITRPYDEGETDLFATFFASSMVWARPLRGTSRLMLFHGCLELFPVFRLLDGLVVGADQLDVVLFQECPFQTGSWQD